MTALYIHWPFCKKKCPYCDFNSHVRSNVEYDDWQKALFNEMQYMAEISNVKNVSSIFFGGGTPSLMPVSLVSALINEAERIFGFDGDIEITLEANPTSFEADKFKQFKAAGVNRLSLGVQALNDADLAFLGREHSAKEAINVLDMAQKIFTRFSFDLIYARPNQTPTKWRGELTEALQFLPTHLSLYQLTIEEDTPFARLHAARKFALPDEDCAIELYEITEELCNINSLHSYEVSNYAATNQQSSHNLTYWRGGDYIGIGAGAHGRILDHDGQWFATQTYKRPERWLERASKNRHAIEIMQPLSAIERAEEILLTGLRLREGIEIAKIAPALNVAKMQLLAEMNLINITHTHIIISKNGQLLIENIARELIL